MLLGFAKKFERTPSWTMIEHTVRRNFGGLDDIDAVSIFKEKLRTVLDTQEVSRCALCKK